MASSKTSAPAERADELRRRLEDASYSYYVLDDPDLTDAEFDRLYDELVELERKHPELQTADSPTQRVGSPLSDAFPKVEHRTPMGSLEKVTTEEGLRKWADDVRKRLGTDEPVAYVTEPKIDGSAVSLVYEAGAFARGATRGDGIRGEDVTPNLRTIKSIPLRVRADDEAPPLIDVRGEIYFPLSAFNRLNERLVGGGQEDGAEPAQRRRRLVAPEESRDHGLTGPVHLGLRARHGGRNLLRAAFRGARLAPRARLPHEPVRGAARNDRGRRARLRRMGDEARRARLRDRRDRDQGRLARPAAAAGRAACAAALGARLQVGADDRPDEAREDPHPRRPHRATSTPGRSWHRSRWAA